MKKPPLAPKPRLLASPKPAPPPIAPKPEILLPSPSPAALKRGKPAVAPKPCLPKVSPKAQQKPPPSTWASPVQARQSLGNTQCSPTSKNGGPSHLSHYIIPPLPDTHHIGNGKSGSSEEASETVDDDGPIARGSPTEDIGCDSAKDCVVPQQHGGQHAPPDSLSTPPDVHEEPRASTLGKDHEHAQMHESAPTCVQSYAPTDGPVRKQEQPGDLSELGSHRVQGEACVPAAPSKPLPVPQPRRPRRAALLRQKVVEVPQPEMPTCDLPDLQTDALKRGCEDIQGSTLPDVSIKSNPECVPPSDTSPASTLNTKPDTNISHCTGPSHNAGSTCSAHNSGVATPEPVHHSDPSISEASVFRDDDGEVELQPPAPPPRQMSLPQKDHFMSSSMDDLHLSDHTDPRSPDETLGKEEERCDADGAYGDFARYPLTRSLPKQIKLDCGPQGLITASSAEDSSPKVAPKKPQRHSLPAAALLRKQNTPPQTRDPPPAVLPPDSSPAPFVDLPARPDEKPASRRLALPSLALPSLALFGKPQPPQGGGRPRALVKQRAKSFSSADLLCADATAGGGEQLVRAEQGRRSLRKLLELRSCVRLLPKLLRGSATLDCTSAEPEPGGRVEPAADEVAPADEDGDFGVEYENVPLYEEIPEYMNLPWVYSSQDADTGVYEVQEPYGVHRARISGDHSDEEEGLSSNEEDENSSTSSKEDLDQSKNREEVEKAKRNKVVHIAMEIMSSEKVFVDVLKLLHIDFRDAVAKATRASGKPVVEEKVLNQILYYLPQLYELNKDLLRELEERVAHWSDHQRLADIFVQKGPYLKMYSTYIREFDRNVALLDEQCRKNPSFATVVRQFETSPRCASLALKHYLLKPVQRIPQYQLLLTDYLKNLPEDSSDYKDTQTALGVVKEVANHANDIMKQGDNFQKLMQVQYSLNGHHEIVQPGRVFLKEGTLMKLSRKVMQPRMFFLFNDILLYTTPVQSGQYKVNSMLSLAGMKVSKPSQEAYQNELNIESVERSFILSASSATERDEWLEAIATAIDDYTRKKISFISSRSQESEGTSVDGPPLGSKAPIWIPDLRTTMCMICTCEFTLTWRRHHCRACGKVVCQACSSNKYYLEYLKNQLARVCDHCYAKLQQKDKGDLSGVSISPSSRTSAFNFSRKQKKIPSALKEVSANTENSSMSGYLQRSKGNKKPWKRLWFVIKNKVLYTYAASEDVAALESQPLLGFFLREEKSGPAQKLQFKLYHKNTLYYIFRAEDIPTAQRWIEAFQEAMIL
ncbi:FYVE, RhoGEF and PH domain-containing protein 6 isoform X2 [Brachyhypopomus gauderio]